MLVHLFHSLPRQDCSLQDMGWCLVQPGWREVAGAALQKLAPCPGVSLDFPKLVSLRHHLAQCPPPGCPQSISAVRDSSWDGAHWAAAIRAARTHCPQQGLSLGTKPLVRAGLLTGVTHAWVSLVLTL